MGGGGGGGMRNKSIRKKKLGLVHTHWGNSQAERTENQTSLFRHKVSKQKNGISESKRGKGRPRNCSNSAKGRQPTVEKQVLRGGEISLCWGGMQDGTKNYPSKDVWRRKDSMSNT